MMRVRYFGSFGQKSGYAQATHDNLLALHRAGVDLNIRPLLDADPSWMPERYEELIPLVNRTDNGADAPGWPTHIIVHTIPLGLNLFVTDEMCPPDHVKRIGITTWETDRFPLDAAKMIIEHFDQVWVPSQFCREAFVNAGIPDHAVKVVWHTFDPKVWWPNGWRPERVKHERARGVVGAVYPPPYTFYSILTWCERKNPMGLLKAYLTEFTQADNVLLRIKTPGHNHAQVDELARGLGLRYLPPVDLVEEHFTEAQMRQFHVDGDCYVTAARAEGWGLGAFEALIMGNPCIATGYSGLREFMDEADNVEQLDFFLTPAYTPETPSNTIIEAAGLRIQAVDRNDHLGIRGDQEWAEPDLHDLKRQMRWAYMDRRGKTDSNMKYMEQCFGYENVAGEMVKLMEELVQEKAA